MWFNDCVDTAKPCAHLQGADDSRLDENPFEPEPQPQAGPFYNISKAPKPYVPPPAVLGRPRRLKMKSFTHGVAGA